MAGSGLAERLKPGQTVICAGARLARRVRHDYAQRQQRQGRRAWESPDVLPWSAWLKRSLDRCRARAAAALLTQAQETWLWREIIEAATGQSALLQTESVARQAAQAWQCARQYLIPIFPRETPLNDDARAFKTWADAYRARCQDNGWTDQASLPDVLCQRAADNPAAIGRELILVGFDQYTPQQERLWRALRDIGIKVTQASAPPRNATVEVMAFADVNEEIRAAAQWARRRVEANAEATVGILTPDLRALRRRIRYVFEDELAPGHLCAARVGAQWPFSISAGEPLAEYPLAHVAFSILGMTRATLSPETLGTLLRAPFIGAYQEELDGRALLDERLRARGRPALTWDEVLRLSERMAADGQRVTRITAMLRAARRQLDELPAQQSPAAWAASFDGLLEIFGWPGERSLDSAEYQQVEAWKSVLDDLVAMQRVAPRMARAEALSQLRRAAAGLNFQPETGETPIQALDPQGAAAMGFDHIWMLGLSEDVWPPRRRPNPFIPLALQRARGVPEADPDATLQRCERLQAGLARACAELALSHPRNTAEQPLLGSPLLPDDAPAQTHERQAGAAPYWQTLFAGGAQAMEEMSDVEAPPVAGLRRGGASLLRDQSQCPFRAVARHRLHAREPVDVDLGPDAMRRGQLLHQLLQDVWSHLQDQAALAALSADERRQLAQSRAQTLMAQASQRDPLTFTPGFAGLEAERLARLLYEWLELELQRPPFSVVGVEQEVSSRVGNLEFVTRLDRVDVLEDGRHVVIDYKTGRAKVKSWTGQRPDEPQLPLYAVNHTDAVAAAAFAILRPGAELGYEGLAESQDILPGIKAFADDARAGWFTSEQANLPDWAALFDGWRVVLQDLAQEFLQGVATVTPKPRACDWCEQQPLCRIHELTAAGDSVPEAPDE